MYFQEERIGRILKELKKQIRPVRWELEGWLFIPCGYKHGSALPQVTTDWKVFDKGQRWGGVKDSHVWFYKKFTLPKELQGKTVELEITTGKEGGWDATNPQFIAYINGKIAQGVDINHTSVLLQGGDCFEVYLYAYTGMTDDLLEFKTFLCTVEEKVEKLYYDIKVPLDICAFLDKNDKNYIDIISYLENAVNMLDFRCKSGPGFIKSVENATSYLNQEFYNKYCGNSDVTTICIGHTHIDVAWLWTLAQTREKVQRTFATVVSLMRQYPEYKFMSSQAQLYKYVKEEAPELYEEIKALVKEGRWEVEGAFWLEADCNLSSGESLVRQVLFGKRFFKEEFGVDSKILWLPDVFGYSAALPQILKKSGVDYFLTSKISWNEYNTMPYDTFKWQGLDGTEILSYFLTAQDKKRGEKPVNFSTYVAFTTPSMVAGCWDRYHQKDINKETLLTFGYGDGGGGPTKEHLEMARRLNYGIKGCPKAQIDTATNFFKRLNDRVWNNKKLPKWVGELYLEYHRGTYTSIAKNKRNNRKSEFQYQNIEWLSSLNMLLCGGAYPQGAINAGWETILLNQFHDIIPGSSIFEVYEDSDRDYARIKAVADDIQKDCVDAIASNVDTQGGIIVFNPLGFENSDVVNVDGRLVYAPNIPAKGYKVISETPVPSKVKAARQSIENDFFKVLFDQNGNITSIFDKRYNREVVKNGERANVLQAFEDMPHNYDAWDINIYYREKMWEVNEVKDVKVIDEGVRAGIEITKTFSKSVITQKIYLYNDIPRIDFDTRVDWKEEHILLKAAFPVDVHAEKAVYDIQFGNVERPTHWNTSWDMAKFEVCAHKWADISEDGYGVSLLNDCKYGYDIKDSTIRLTLLKSATEPNVHADRCMHEFVYSLYPHGGDFREGRTAQMAYSLNQPMIAKAVGSQKGRLKSEYSMLSVDKENIFIETVKKAENSDDLVVRMYEGYNRRVVATIKLGFKVKSAALCDLLENEKEDLKVEGDSLHIEIKPYEIITLKLKV